MVTLPDGPVASRPGASAVALVRALESADSDRAVCRSFQTFVESLGFSSFTCSTLSLRGRGSPARTLMTTRPAPFLRRYAAGDMHRVDPVLIELKRRQRPFQWSEMVAARALSPRESDVLRLAAEYGMDEGFVVPIPEANGLVGVVDAGGPSTALSEEARATLILGSGYLYQRLCRFARRPAEPARITSREAEVLGWIACGKSDWQIGQILGISKKTVNYHIENVKRKFGVATRVQAVIAALASHDLASSGGTRRRRERTAREQPDLRSD